MSAHVLLYLLNELWKSNKMQVKILSLMFYGKMNKIFQLP